MVIEMRVCYRRVEELIELSSIRPFCPVQREDGCWSLLQILNFSDEEVLVSGAWQPRQRKKSVEEAAWSLSSGTEHNF